MAYAHIAPLRPASQGVSQSATHIPWLHGSVYPDRVSAASGASPLGGTDLSFVPVPVVVEEFRRDLEVADHRGASEITSDVGDPSSLTGDIDAVALGTVLGIASRTAVGGGVRRTGTEKHCQDHQRSDRQKQQLLHGLPPVEARPASCSEAPHTGQRRRWRERRHRRSPRRSRQTND